VTSEQSADQAVAISQPTTPPPTITSRPGTACALVASRLVHGLTLASTSGTDALVPVAITTACRAASTVSPTWTRRIPTILPWPRKRSIFARLSHSTCPSSFHWWAKESRRASTSAGLRRAPATPRTAAASATAVAGRSSALLGMHAQYEHSPPTSSASTIAAVSPPRIARSATFSPVGPAPITTTSYASPAIPPPR
jgi:hypothetical protein